MINHGAAGLTPSSVRRVYDRIGRHQDSQRFYEDPAVNRLLELAAVTQATTLLELGSGTGRLARGVAQGRRWSRIRRWRSAVCGQLRRRGGLGHPAVRLPDLVLRHRGSTGLLLDGVVRLVGSTAVISLASSEPVRRNEIDGEEHSNDVP